MGGGDEAVRSAGPSRGKRNEPRSAASISLRDSASGPALPLRRARCYYIGAGQSSSTKTSSRFLRPRAGRRRRGRGRRARAASAEIGRVEEDHRVAAGDDHRAAQVLLEQRAEDEAEQERRRLAAELDEDVADHAEDGDGVDVEVVAGDRVAADAGEDDDRREEHPVGDGQELHPEPDQRQVEQDQHQVADPHRDDDAPEERRLVVDDVGAGGDALDDEGADHQRHHRVRRDAEGQHRDERGLGGGVVGALGAGDALDGAVAELLAGSSRGASRSSRRRRRRARGRRRAARRAPSRARCRAGPARRCGGTARGSARGSRRA